MKIATRNFHRCFLTLLVVLLLYSPLRAQKTDEDGQFHLGFTGSAVFPYDPKGQSGPGGEGIKFKAVRVAPTFVLKYNIRTRSLADQGAIEDVLAVEDDVVPFDRADVLGAGLRQGLPW